MPGKDYTYSGTVLEVHDGDTLKVTLDLGLRITYTCPIRVRHVDSPELSTPEGRAARDWLTERVLAGTSVVVRTQKPDKYGRILADVTVLPDGWDVATDLVAAGHARPYEGGTRTR